MNIKNIVTKFDWICELIDSESLTYLKIKDTDGIIQYGIIDNWREINHLDESLEEFRKRVLIAYEVSNALNEVKEDEKRLPWERDEDWWKHDN